MLKLHARLACRWDADSFVARIALAADRPSEARSVEALIVDGASSPPADGFAAYLTRESVRAQQDSAAQSAQVIELPPSLDYLMAGDIVRIVPRTGEIITIYRRNSQSNALLATERCNSECIMCSQPPKDVDDSFLIDTYLQAIPLMDPATTELGITGGEPTLLGDQLSDLIRACKQHLPQTALHMLSNGRLFNYVSLCQQLAAIGHPKLVIGIPLYSDLAAHHDFVVQATGAFDQTIRGIMNLKRCGIDVELRVVLHRHTVDRLPELAQFIARNLPVVDHVALMGLELMGYAKMNLEALWIDPAEYQLELVRGARILCRAGLNVSIYNHQLCVLDRQLWSLAAKSISDWKNEYLEICDGCGVKDRCGGFFFSSKLRHSTSIRPIVASDAELLETTN